VAANLLLARVFESQSHGSSPQQSRPVPFAVSAAALPGIFSPYSEKDPHHQQIYFVSPLFSGARIQSLALIALGVVNFPAVNYL